MTKPTKWAVCPAKNQISLSIHQSDQSLRCPHEEALGPKLPIERTAKTLIRLGGCPGWSESSLGAHVILFVLSCCGSFDFISGVKSRRNCHFSIECVLWVVLTTPHDYFTNFAGAKKMKQMGRNRKISEGKPSDGHWQTELAFSQFVRVTVLGHVWANSAGQDQRSSLIRVYTVCNSLCIFWIHYSKETTSC